MNTMFGIDRALFYLGFRSAADRWAAWLLSNADIHWYRLSLVQLKFGKSNARAAGARCR